MGDDRRTLPEVQEKITSGGHYKVLIAPSSFEPNRLASPTEFEEIIRASTVSVRGWDYPHTGNRRDAIVQSPKTLTCYTDWEEHLEVWRLYRSGQFVHLFAFWENEDFYQKELVRYFQGTNPEIEGFSGFVDVMNVVWTLTEICLFLARFGSRIGKDEEFNLTIEFKNVYGKGLSTSTFNRRIRNLYICSEPEIHLSRVLTLTSVLGGYRETAQQLASEAFAWFGYSAPMEVIQSMQEELLPQNREA